MPKVPLFNFIAGVNTGVSPFLVGGTSLTIQNGCVTSHKLGAILKDIGYSRVSTNLESGKSITGLFDFHQNSSTQKVLATVNDSTDDDTQLFYKTPAGAWTEVTAAETAWAGKANIAVEMEAFIEHAFFVGWESTDGFLPVGSLTGTTFSTSANVTDMAQGRFIKRYRDRLYVANTRLSAVDYPYRVYFSSIPSAGAITWAATDFFDVDYGEEIVGLYSNWDRLLVFTRRKTYMYDQIQRKKVWDFGCSNHRTIRSFGQKTIWCTTDNVVVSTGGEPALIGGEVIDFIRAGNPLDFFAEIVDDEYHLYIGTVTVTGISGAVTYVNTELVYNFNTDSWRWRELADDMTIKLHYFDTSTGTQRLYMGDTAGNVWDKSKYTDTVIANSDSETTLGTAVNDIHARFTITIPLTGNMAEAEINRLIAYADRAIGLKLKARALDRNSRVLKEFRSLGELKSYVNIFDVECDNGAILQIEGTEYGTNPYWSFYGLELEIEKYSDSLTGQNA